MSNTYQRGFSKQEFGGLRDVLMAQGVASAESKFLSLLPPLVMILLTSGCAINHDYEWSEYPIKSERVTQTINFPASSGVQITNGHSQADNEELGSLGVHHYYGSLRQLTEAIVVQVSDELVKRNIRVGAGVQKSLELDVISREFTRGVWVIRTDMVLRVKDGNGAAYDLDISNTTGGAIPRLYDGAVSVATIVLLNDPRIKAYLEGP